jgi:hypothetical protein
VPLDFGAIAPCRTCNGTGKSRNPQWGDKNLARERQRVRRRGGDVETPKEVTTCIECGGKGYLPAPIADKARVAREDDRASIAGDRP